MKVFQHQNDPLKSDLVIIPVCWSLDTDVNFEKKIKPLIDFTNEIELFHEYYGFQKGCKIAIDAAFKASQGLDESVSRAIQETNWDDAHQSKSSIQLIKEDYKKLTSIIEEKVEYWLGQDKLVLVLGGDASISLGSVKGIATVKNGFGLFHFSAYPFLKAYDGGRLMEENTVHNIGLKIPEINKILGVGYRDISQKEYSVQKENKEKIIWFSEKKNLNYQFIGEPFSKIAKRWVNNLPEFVHLSIHCSVLDVYSVDQIEFALQQLVLSRRKIIGVDISGIDKELNNKEYKDLANLLYIVAKTYGRSRGKN